MAEGDDEIWGMLDKAQLSGFIKSLEGGLDAAVTENGDNFSVGQGQCLCMARALLRRPKVLVLDEATASIDAETDLAIQNIVRTQLNSCTVLTIAHRLHTIMDYDRVLVMDDGEIGEYDTPAQLARKPGGLLAKLIEETGPESAAYLRRIAAGEKLHKDTHAKLVRNSVDNERASVDRASVDRASSGGMNLMTRASIDGLGIVK